MHASAQYNDIVPATLVGTSNMGPSEQDDFSMSIDFDANGVHSAGTFFGGDGRDYFPAGINSDILEPDIARNRFIDSIRDYGAGLDIVYDTGGAMNSEPGSNESVRPEDSDDLGFDIDESEGDNVLFLDMN